MLNFVPNEINLDTFSLETGFSIEEPKSSNSSNEASTFWVMFPLLSQVERADSVCR